MKKVSFLILPTIAIIFTVFIFVLVSEGYQTQNTVSLQSVAVQDSPSSTNPQITATGKININTASAKTLTLLSGIGEVLAERIIAYREEHGPFSQVSDLLEVKGIGEAKLKGIVEYIAVE